MKTSPLLASILLAAAAISTTSCRSTLYRAAEEGDVQAVKDELANGAAPSGTASCDGGDDNGGFSEQNVLFTIQ